MNDAFDANCLHEHRRVLYATALRQLRDPALAEDLVQDTFLAALANTSGTRAPFAGRSSVRTWLTGILKHKIVDAIRERARAPVSYDETLHTDIPEHAAHDDDAAPARAQSIDLHGIDAGPEAVIARKRFLEACQGHLERLSTQGARAFVLSDVLGHDTEEVCAELGITSSNLWTTLHRTRRSLRGALERVRPV